jgi:hypothetical protein
MIMKPGSDHVARPTGLVDHELSDATRRRHADKRVTNFMINTGKRLPRGRGRTGADGRNDPGRLVELGEESFRRDLSIRLAYDFRDLGPIGIEVDTYPQPAAMPDVGRPEELRGILGDHFLLYARGSGTPERESVGAVVMVVDRYELLADEERRLAVARPLGRFGQGKTDLPQPGDRIHAGKLTKRGSRSWTGARCRTRCRPARRRESRAVQAFG